MSNRPPHGHTLFRSPSTAGGSRPVSEAGPCAVLGQSPSQAFGADQSTQALMTNLKLKIARKDLQAGMETYEKAEKEFSGDEDLKVAFIRLRLLGPPLHTALGEAIKEMHFQIYGWTEFIERIEMFCQTFKENAGLALEMATSAADIRDRGDSGISKMDHWALNTFGHSGLFQYFVPGMNMLGDPLGRFFRGTYRQSLDETEDFARRVWTKKPGEKISRISWELK